MKKITFALIALFFIALTATSQVRMPQPSTTQTIKQDFGMGSLELTYSRPNAKDRKVFGNLVPFGKLWRTGANSATKFTINEPIEIGGKNLDTGSYVIYTIPNVGQWEIIINKGLTNWGIDGYKAEQDVLRFFVTPTKLKQKIETFTMQFANVQPESCQLDIMWEKTAINIPITTNIKDKVRAQLEKALQGDKKPYWQATQFYNEFDNDKKKALEMATKGVEANSKAFWIWLYKARLEKDLGDKTAAKASAERTITEATTAKNDDYIKMATEFIAKL